ncbi:MAG TPA: FHA domain-containing protein [Verrucomicrobiae bacterium]|nr:FHA domain-containing protein [Verrucomicrobiae bacterium]
MVQLSDLSGKTAGATWAARRFPVLIGRGVAADLRVEADGVWDQHARLEFHPLDGFVLRAQGEALASINGQPVQEAVLRNGDVIELGSLKLQFWLSETRQTGLTAREWMVWFGIGLVLMSEVALIYRLLVF